MKNRFSIYKKRNIIERFFARLQQFRNIVTRDNRLASAFPAVIHACGNSQA
ncbi:transposase [Komagataeibacter nataicola]|uniref:Transposase n=1 Tax=Komagataeibacter nataicola TaxID=265960 RepID=A0ABX5P6H4_9PROT|nr:transposase [Komagataeibacter nataicola]PYD64851.1 hypothetical protein CDI09_16950 [Komagataeibacter nataicola]